MNNDNNGDSDSDELALSSETLAALNEFLLNQQLKENLQKTNEIPRENWQASNNYSLFYSKNLYIRSFNI